MAFLNKDDADGQMNSPVVESPVLENLGEVVAALARAYEELDVAALVQFYADDSEWLDTAGRRTRGRDQLRAHLERLLESGWVPDGALSGEAAITVRTIDPDIALAWISTTGPKTRPHAEQRLRRMQVLRRRDGRWQVVAELVVDRPQEPYVLRGSDTIGSEK